jgi:two-component system, cell cycle response regulator
MGGDGTAKARLLVVDDSKLMRKAAVKMLGDEFDIVLAEDGQQAWIQLESDPTIQVLFTDLNMPVVDGYELLERVRGSGDPGVQSLPVIVMTGAENDEDARMQALQGGATDFITKPFTASDLLARARAHASHRRKTAQLEAQTTLDALTGLANKAGFLQRLQQDLAYARRHLQPMCVVRVELDDFRRLFLGYGREVAEGLLLRVARMLQARIRKEDTAARIGLGGFALTLPGAQVAGIEGMLERLRGELAADAPRGEDGLVIPLTLSAGVTNPGLDGGDAAASFAHCEEVLKRAPAGGTASDPGEPWPEIEVVSLETTPAAAEPAVAAPREAAVPEPVQVPVPAPEPTPEPTPPVASPSLAPADLPDAVASAPAPVPQATPAPPASPSPAAATAATAAATPAPTVAGRSTAPATAASLRLDPLLDELARGNVGPMREQLPQAIGRLLPLFRLLGPKQRAQLIAFLQKLG